MPEHPQFNDDAIVNPETHHEESDVNTRALMLFVVIFIVFAAVTHVALWLLYKFYVQVGVGQNAMANPPLTSILRPADPPALPRLQPFATKGESDVSSPVADTPVADMERMRAEEEKVLDHAGWVDRQKGIVHIPIDTAKNLALQRGIYQLNTASVPAPVAIGAGQTAVRPPAPAVPPTQGNPNSARAGATTNTGTRK